MTHGEVAGQIALEEDELLLKGERGLWSDAFRRLLKNKAAVAGLVLLTAIVALAIAGNTLDVVQRYSTTEQDYGALFEDPSWTHWFGTDHLGRDIWARVLQGLLISLMVGFGVQVFVITIGTIVGGLAALGGRAMDNVMMRITDIAYAFPDLLFIILLRSVMSGRDIPLVSGYYEDILLMTFAIGFVAWVTIARLIRGQMLSLAQRDFVIAAEAMGATRMRIVFKHMMPNCVSPVIVAVVFGIPLAIFAEAVLGFIGIGVARPTASLGVLTADGYKYIQTHIWMVVFPTAVIAILMMCFTFLGDGLRDALDPRTR